MRLQHLHYTLHTLHTLHTYFRAGATTPRWRTLPAAGRGIPHRLFSSDPNFAGHRGTLLISSTYRWSHGRPVETLGIQRPLTGTAGPWSFRLRGCATGRFTATHLASPVMNCTANRWTVQHESDGSRSIPVACERGYHPITDTRALEVPPPQRGARVSPARRLPK